MFNKRGQISIFVAIGVVLLIIFGIIFYSFSEETLSRGNLLLDDVPQDFLPLQTYVHSCLEEIGSEAIEILGVHGGYLIEDEIDAMQDGVTVSSQRPTFSTGFYFFPQTKDVIIPYWFYYDDSANTFKSGMPKQLISDSDDGYERIVSSDRSVEAQIDQYVNANLGKCMIFETFEEDFDIEEAETVRNIGYYATTYITEDDVMINLWYPLDVEKGGSERSFENFGVRIPVKLKKTFELAQFITEKQIELNYLENNMMNMVAIYSMPDSNKLAPTSDFAFVAGESGASWKTVDLKENMQNILSMTTSMMNMQGASDYDKLYVTPEDASYETRQKVYDNMILPAVDVFAEEVEDSTLYSTDISFAHLDWWPIYFRVNGGKEEVRPKTKGVSLGPLNIGLQEYETNYDVSWPVLVKLKETESFNGKGFEFNFGLEGNLRRNVPLNSSAFTNTLVLEDSRNPNLCNEKNLANNVSVVVRDLDLNPVSDALISFRTGSETCILANTNSSGEAIVGLPTGVLNGWITASKDGYLDEKVQFIPDADGYELNGIKKFNNVKFEVMKYVVETTEFVPLDDSDQVMVSLTRYDEEGDDGDFLTTFIVNSSGFETDFITGNYDVSLNLFNLEKEMTFPMMEGLEGYEDDLEEVNQEISDNVGGDDDYFENDVGGMLGGLDLTYDEDDDL